MGSSASAVRLLSELPTFEEEHLTVVVETPRGSRSKYNYDERYGAFRLGGVLPAGMSFPHDFGLIPSTVGEDGDPLDVLLLLDAPVVVGCIVAARLIGVIEAEQREDDGKWVRNDRLLAVATRSRSHAEIRRLDDLRPQLVEEIEAFFAQYNRLNGKEFKPTGHGDGDKARRLVEAAQARFAERGSA